MEPTHVMSFAGAGGIVESITLCGVEPGQVDQLTVHKGQLELVRERTSTVEGGARISAGQALARRAAMEGRAGMRIEFLEGGGGLWSAGAPIVLSAWLAPGQLGKLQVVVTYRPDR